MEEDQELKHSCKLCSKSFPCGRSLGGHMRSHVINSHETHHKKKLSSLTNNGGNNAFFPDAGYGLRENPRKTCRFEDLGEDSLLLCKECGKGFQSWKALFGHMKCHSERVEEEDDDDDSWTLVMEDSQSDNEIGVPNRRKRSSRRIKRYIATINANGSPSVCEIEQEQEEVAMCLMMLSRDVGHWGGGLNSVGESSYNNFDFLEARLSSKIKGENKNSICNRGEVVKFKKLRNGKLEATVLDPEKCKSGERKSEFGSSGVPRNGSKMNKSEIELGKNLVTESEFYLSELGSRKSNSSKRKGHDLFDPELDYGASDSQEMYREKKSKFECTTCNKTFHSYQALGGHRASHKKLKGCSGSKINGGENSLETDQISANPTDHETSYGSKKNKGGSHECPICFRVFSSGQALGGHKRSHLIGVCSEAKSNQISSRIETQRPIQETAKDFLDLNMPAPVEEEGSNSHGGGFKPWWVGSNRKHEPPVGLLTN